MQEKNAFIEQIRSSVASGLYDQLPQIPVREPVINHETTKRLGLLSADGPQVRSLSKEINQESLVFREWGVLTLLLHDCLKSGDLEVTQIISDFYEKPIEQSNPLQLIITLTNLVVAREPGERSASQQRILSLFTRFNLIEAKKAESTGLAGFMAVPEVPNSLLRGALSGALEYVNPNAMIQFHTRDIASDPTASYRQTLDDSIISIYERFAQNHLSGSAFAKGITSEEQILLAIRFQMCRDLKMLALEAKIRLTDQDQIEIHTTDRISAQEAIAQLINPDNWKSITNIKDRVQRVTVMTTAGQKTYILKQHKTNQHLDTPIQGDVSVSSQSEFEMAEHLTDYHFSTTDIDLKWEQALGYVNIPDMEFVVFEDFEAETALGTTAEDISAVILEHQSDHEAEFQALKKFISTQRLLGFIPASIQADHREQELEALQPDYVEGKSKRTSKLVFLHHALTGLSSQKSFTFEKFARLKANLLILKAGTLTDLIAKNAGFTDFDTGRALQITQASPLKITSTTYDFEASELVSQTQNFEIAGRLVDRITSRAAYEFLHYLQGLSPSEKIIFTHMLEAEEIIPA